MKKYIIFINLIISSAAFFYLPQTQAAELKRACIKAYPDAAGETDSALIGLYQQLCDKPAKKNILLQQELKTEIVKRYVELDSSLKALNLINQLQHQQDHSPALTDLSFRAGIGIASAALEHMRSTEVRALNETTYAPAKSFIEKVKFAKPVPIAVEVRPLSASSSKNIKKHMKTSPKRIAASSKSSKAKITVKSAPAKKTENISTSTHIVSSNPFGSLKNN